LKIGTKQEIRALEEVALRPADGHVAQEHHSRVFPVDLAGVDPRLRQHGRLARRAERLGRERAAGRGDDHPDVAPLGALPDRHDLEIGRGVGEPLEPGDRLRVAGRAQQPALLERRSPRVALGDCERAALPVPRDRRRKDRALSSGCRVGPRRGALLVVGARVRDGRSDGGEQEGARGGGKRRGMGDGEPAGAARVRKHARENSTRGFPRARRSGTIAHSI